MVLRLGGNGNLVEVVSCEVVEVKNEQLTSAAKEICMVNERQNQ